MARVVYKPDNCPQYDSNAIKSPALRFPKETWYAAKKHAHKRPDVNMALCVIFKAILDLSQCF